MPPSVPPSQQRQKHTPPPPFLLLLLSFSLQGLRVCVRPLNVATDGKPTLAARRPSLLRPPTPPPPVLKPTPPTIRPSMGFDNKQFPTLTRIVLTTGGQSSHDNYMSTLVNPSPGYLLFFPPTLPPPPPPFLSCICSAMPMSKRALQHTTHRTPRSRRIGCKQQQQRLGDSNARGRKWMTATLFVEWGGIGRPSASKGIFFG